MQGGHGGDGLAAAGLADDGEGLSWVEGHADAVDGLDARASLVVEGDGEVLDAEEGLGRGGCDGGGWGHAF